MINASSCYLCYFLLPFTTFTFVPAWFCNSYINSIGIKYKIRKSVRTYYLKTHNWRSALSPKDRGTFFMVINIRLFFPDIESDYNHINNPVGTAFRILLYFSSLFHNIDFFFMPCRGLHLARFRGQIRTGRKYARLLVKNFQPPHWTDWKIFAKTRRARSGLADF